MTIMIRMMLNLYQGEAEIPQSAVTSFATARSVRRTASEAVMVDGCWMYVETSTKRSDTELQVPSWDNLVDEFDGCHDDEFVAADETKTALHYFICTIIGGAIIQLLLCALLLLAAVPSSMINAEDSFDLLSSSNQ
jgi:hypothetical protein